MAVPAEELLTQMYEEPPDLAFILNSSGERHMRGHRLAKVAGRISLFEPLQEGVVRYPPVFVEVKRDAERVREYIHMAPNRASVSPESEAQ